MLATALACPSGETLTNQGCVASSSFVLSPVHWVLVIFVVLAVAIFLGIRYFLRRQKKW